MYCRCLPSSDWLQTSSADEGEAGVRMVIGIAGPLLVLAAAMLMATYGIATEWLLYPGLVIMIGVAIWDLKATRSDPTPINADLPTMRRCLDRNDADRCLPVFLRLPALRRSAEAIEG